MLHTLRNNSFLLSVVGLALLCALLSGQARADVKGIPFNDQFQSASYPYARVVNGCTTWRRPVGMGDEWSGVSFAGACEQHDRCFHTPKASWGDCNQGFQDDLRHACDRDLEAARLAKGGAGKPDGQALQLCYEIANMYLTQVQTSDGAKRFEFAQKQTALYTDYVRKVIDQTYRAVLHRAASQKDIDRALQALTEDNTLDDLKSALMGSRIDQEMIPTAMVDGIDTDGE